MIYPANHAPQRFVSPDNIRAYGPNNMELFFVKPCIWALTFAREVKFRLFLCRFTHAIVYYGVSVGSIDLGGNKYLNFFLISLVGTPASFALIWALNRFGKTFHNIRL